MHKPSPPGRLADLGPGVVAAISFAIADVFSKLTFIAGMDVLSLSTFRSLFSIVFMIGWFAWRPAAVPHTPRQRWISLGIGVLFAGIVYGLFKAIELATVPLAILTYFVYPLLTGIAGSLIGIDRVGWRGAASALIAFCGLALIVGAEPGAIALTGIAFALGAACLRTTPAIAAEMPRSSAWAS